MTTLAQDKPRVYELGDLNHIPVVAADIIFEGAAIGVVIASGHARPLTSVDGFAGFANDQADNLLGSAADIYVESKRQGEIELLVSGAVLTDFWQPVYATDDDTFSFLPTGGVFVGFVKRFVSSGKVIVAFDVDNFVDPWAGYVCETISANKTLDVEDTGKAFFVDTDATTTTLPATTTGIDCVVVNAGAYGTVAVNLDPQAADKIMGPDIAGADNKDLINTKATAQRGDFVALKDGHADGYIIKRMSGTWATEG